MSKRIRPNPFEKGSLPLTPPKSWNAEADYLMQLMAEVMADRHRDGPWRAMVRWHLGRIVEMMKGPMP